MRNAIGMDREYTKEVSFDYLENLGIKRGKRERARYKALSDILRKIKITLYKNRYYIPFVLLK